MNTFEINIKWKFSANQKKTQRRASIPFTMFSLPLPENSNVPDTVYDTRSQIEDNIWSKTLTECVIDT